MASNMADKGAAISMVYNMKQSGGVALDSELTKVAVYLRSWCVGVPYAAETALDIERLLTKSADTDDGCADRARATAIAGEALLNYGVNPW